MLAAVQEQRAIAPGTRCRIFHGGTSLSAGISLADIGVTKGSQLTLVVLPPQRVLTASSDGTAKLWVVASGECLRTFEGHRDDVMSAVFSPDGQEVLTASDDRTAKLWSAASGECLRAFKGHERSVSSAVFSPDGQEVLSASADRTAKLWSAASGESLRTLEGHEGAVSSAVFSLDG